jgi:hypothetical protein
MFSYVASSILLFTFAAQTKCGPLDWARADRLPIDVNLPWLPCKFGELFSFLFNYFSKVNV